MTRTLRRPRHALAAAVAAVGALAAVVLVSSAASARQADKAGLIWTVSWSAPTTSAGPNPFAKPVELKGTAKYALGKVSQVTYTITTSSSLPSTCGKFPLAGKAVQSGSAFSIEPELACNGTYSVSVVAQNGSGPLAAKSQPLTAPFTLADPGSAPAGLEGVAQGSTRTVTLSWSADPDPDVVGYRVRRDGVAVADTPANVRIHSDVAPGYGRFAYDVQSLRWGAGGPGSTPVASPASAPLIATIAPDAPPTPVTSKPTTSGSGSTGHVAGGHGSTAPTTSHAPTPHLPSASKANASLPARSDYRSGGSISLDTPTTTVDDGYAERLPYKARTSRDAVDLAGPDRTRSVSKTVAVPGRKGVGLLVPIAIVVVLLAGALQVRGLVGRASALAAADAEGSDD